MTVDTARRPAPTRGSQRGVPARERPSRGLPGKRWVLLGAMPGLTMLVLPALLLIPMSFTSSNVISFPPSQWGLGAYESLVADDAWARAFGSSLLVGLVAVAIVVVAGSLAAVGLASVNSRLGAITTGFVLIPIAMPLVVLGLSTLQFFGRLGFTGSLWGIALAHAVIGVPYVFMTVRATLSRLDIALIRSAESLGASNLSVLRWVYIPAIRPAVLSGAVLAFAVSFDEVVLALFLSGPDAITLPVKLFTEVQFQLTPAVLAVSTLLFVLVAAIATVGAMGYAYRDWLTSRRR